MDPVQLVSLLVLLACSAYFSGAETALFSMTPWQLDRLRRKHPGASRAVDALLEKPRSLLTTVLVGNTAVNVLFSVLAASVFVSLIGGAGGPFLATLVMTVILLVFGEIIPKTIAVAAPVRASRLVTPSLSWVHRLLRPLTRTTVEATDHMSGWLERRVAPRAEALSEDEIKTLITMGREYGVLGEREKEFIHNVFHLNDRLVEDIMTPRARVFSLAVDARLTDVREPAAAAGFSRIPVYETAPENIVGYVEVTDLLWDGEKTNTQLVRDVMRELHFYPDGKRVGSLLLEMREADRHITGVVDEHGSFAGVVTLEDAVEEVVGEILDLHDRGRFATRRDAAGHVVVSAQMELDVFNELMDCDLRDDEVATIGGYVLHQLGRIPQVGDKLVSGNLVFVVDKAEPQRIVELRIQRRDDGAKHTRGRRGRLE